MLNNKTKLLYQGTPGCGGVYTAEQEFISSPTDKSTYLPNLLCEWKIQLPVGERIRITWIDFDIEDSDHCAFDSVQVTIFGFYFFFNFIKKKKVIV